MLIAHTLDRMGSKWLFTSVVIPLNTHIPNLTMRKVHEISTVLGIFYTISDQHSSKSSRSPKIRKVLPSGESEGDRITKCNVISWTGS